MLAKETASFSKYSQRLLVTEHVQTNNSITCTHTHIHIHRQMQMYTRTMCS